MTAIIEKIKSFFKRKAVCKAGKPDLSACAHAQAGQPAGERKPEPQKEPAQAEKPKG